MTVKYCPYFPSVSTEAAPVFWNTLQNFVRYTVYTGSASLLVSKGHNIIWNLFFFVVITERNKTHRIYAPEHKTIYPTPRNFKSYPFSPWY